MESKVEVNVGSIPKDETHQGEYSDNSKIGAELSARPSHRRESRCMTSGPM